MDTTLLPKFINHRYRRWTVAGIAMIVLLIGGIPLTEELCISNRKRVESQEAIRLISLQADNLPILRKQAFTKAQLVCEDSGINQTQFSHYRDECLKLVRKHQCRAENVGEGRPVQQPWNESLHPLVVTSTVVKEKPKYEVITKSLNFTIAGELWHLVSLIEEMESLNDFFVPTKLVIQQQGLEHELKLEVEMAMIELVKSTSAK